ncbi:hypothetical protein CCACVL1_07303, partial [Corchorus capsularis]
GCNRSEPSRVVLSSSSARLKNTRLEARLEFGRASFWRLEFGRASFWRLELDSRPSLSL